MIPKSDNFPARFFCASDFRSENSPEKVYGEIRFERFQQRLLSKKYFEKVFIKFFLEVPQRSMLEDLCSYTYRSYNSFEPNCLK